jgi:tetratricopeptide (TPR) repeat protein
MAYQYFLRGVDAWERHDLRAAIQWQEKTVKLDPDFAPALAHLAFDYISYCYQQSAYADPVPIDLGYIEKGLALYQKALDADAASPAILSLGGLYLVELGRLDQAVTLLRRALKLNPNYAEGHLWLSQAYRYGGMLQQSQTEAELALRLDPSIREYSTVNAYLYLGEYDKFLRSMPRTQVGARILFYRGLARYCNRDLRQAENEFDRAYQLQPTLAHAQYGRAIKSGIAGSPQEGLARLRRLEQDYQPDGEMLYKMAQAYAVLGDEKSGLRLLRRSIENNFFCYRYFVRDPLLDSLRGAPEYATLMEDARTRHETFRQKFF